MLPARVQWERVVEHGSVQPDGVPTYKGTLSNLMMHMSPLLMHVLSTGHVEERITSTQGTSVPYIRMWSQIEHTGNVVLIVFSLAHNHFNFYLEFGCYHSNILHGTTQVITSVLLRLRAIYNGECETVCIQFQEQLSA